MKTIKTLLLASAALVSALSPLSAAQIFVGADGNVASTVANFRSAIGGGNVAGAAQSFGGVRREINWDGVPDTLSDPNALPANFFNSNSPRGVVFSTSGSSFITSANANRSAAPLFESFDGAAQGNGSYNFTAFSQQRLFSVLGDTSMTVNFFLAGTNTASFSRAFGAVFVCADTITECDASITARDSQGETIETVGRSGASSSGHFFLGLLGDGSEQFSTIRISFGSGVLGSVNTDLNRVVVMDDFIFAEPGSTGAGAASAVPEPQTFALIGASLISLALLRNR
jgi:hypothetical protein